MIRKDLTISIQYVPTRKGWFTTTEAYYRIVGLPMTRDARADTYYDKASPSSLTVEKYQATQQIQEARPVLLSTMKDNSKRLWMFKGEFYWDSEGHSEDEMHVLLLDRLTKKEKKLSRAKARISQKESVPPGSRDPIADDVKVFVWQRDGGRCVKCGSQQKLEFDHVIPVCKGGSNSARNLQLLCEDCNREKGGDL